MANVHAVQSKGIYHGLPVFPDSAKGLTAIITGIGCLELAATATANEDRC